jgi:two-component system, LytTR family, sensor kinase
MRLASHGHAYVLLYFVIVGIVLGAGAYRALRDREVDAARLQTQLAEAETAALRAQLQPHFLFNILNAISAVVPEDPVMAQRLIARLGDLLRLSIEQHRAQQSSLAEELEFTDVYLAIEEVRLGKRLRIERRIAPEALDVSVPSLLLQPLVENAVRHGLSPLVEGGTLTIEAVLDESSLHLTVADNGKGSEGADDGIGLGNTRARLRQLYGDRQSLSLATAPGKGFRVTVVVPR